MGITINRGQEFQRVEHFGASACWWAQDVGTWPAATRDAILDLLFDREKGIGLNLVRYNIGGGKAGSGIADHWRSAETPWNPDGSLDWSRDAAAMAVVDGAVRRGAGVILFSNSPPWGLTVSGKPTGKGAACNLRPDSREAFAAFLADCAAALAKRWPLVAISPINEPQWDWQPSKGQEGCWWSPADAVLMTRSLVAALKARKLDLPVSVVDSAEWSIRRNKDFLEALLADPVVRQAMGHYAVHSYWSTGEDREDLAALVARMAPGLPIWQTEWTEMRGGRDAGMQGALTLANTVHEDFVLGGVSSWQYWIAASKYDYADGLVYVDPASKTFQPAKRLWALGNWSRFVAPGARRIECEAPPEARLRVSAFKNPDGAIVLVAVNGDSEASPAVKLGLPADGSLDRWETSAAADLALRPVAAGEALRFPAESVTTLVWRP